MWGVGCVMFEIVSLFPLFPGFIPFPLSFDRLHLTVYYVSLRSFKADEVRVGWVMAGVNELDQIQKIHDILGTPPQALLDKMKK